MQNWIKKLFGGEPVADSSTDSRPPKKPTGLPGSRPKASQSDVDAIRSLEQKDVPRLLKFLASPKATNRTAAARRIGQLAIAACQDTLLEVAAQDDSQSVRHAALEALKTCASPDRDDVLKGIEAIDDPYAKATLRVLRQKSEKEQVDDILASLESKSVKELLPLLESPSPEIRRSVFNRLLEIGDGTVLPQLLGTPEIGLEGRRMVEFLMQHGDPESPAILQACNHSSSLIRAAALKLIAKSRQPERDSVLLDALRSRDPELHSIALQGFQQRGGEVAVRALLEAKGDGRATRLLPELIETCCRPSDPELKLAWEHPELEVRLAALRRLRQANPKERVEIMLEAATSNFRAQQLEGLAGLRSISGERVKAVLQKALSDPDKEIREAAAQSLGRIATVEGRRWYRGGGVIGAMADEAREGKDLGQEQTRRVIRRLLQGSDIDKLTEQLGEAQWNEVFCDVALDRIESSPLSEGELPVELLHSIVLFNFGLIRSQGPVKRALDLLGKSGQRLAIQYLRQFLERQGQAGESAAVALARSEPGLRVICLLLDNSKPLIATRARSALETVRTGRLVYCLRGDTKKSRAVVATMLLGRQWKPETTDQVEAFTAGLRESLEMEEGVAAESARAMAGFGTPGFRELVRGLASGTESIRRLCGDVLRRSASDHGEEIARLTFPSIRFIRGDTRLEAARVLSSTGWKARNEEEGALFAMAVGDWKALHAAGPLKVKALSIPAGDPLEDFRRAAADCLEHHVDSTDAEALLFKLARDRKEMVRSQAVWSLRRFPTEKSMSMVASGLQDDSWKVRWTAADALLDTDHPSREELLREFIVVAWRVRAFKDPAVRAGRILEALGIDPLVVLYGHQTIEPNYRQEYDWSDNWHGVPVYDENARALERLAKHDNFFVTAILQDIVHMDNIAMTLTSCMIGGHTVFSFDEQRKRARQLLAERGVRIDPA